MAAFTLGMAGVVFSFGIDQALAVVQHWSYLSCGLSVCGFAVTGGWWLFRRLRELRGGSWREWGGGVLLAVLISLLIQQATYPRGLKIFNDEVLLQSTAQSFYQHRENAVLCAYEKPVLRHNRLEGNPVSLIDKRPVLFPFLVSLLHDLLGFNPANSLRLNMLLTPLLLISLFFAGWRTGGRQAGFFSLLLCGTLPLLAHCATGGGYDLLNVLLVTWLFLVAADFAERGESLSGVVMVFTSLLLVNTRYESWLYIASSVVILGAVQWRRPQRISPPWSLLSVPFLLFVPAMLLWVHRYFGRSFDQSAQLDDAASFSWRFLVAHTRTLMEFLFAWNLRDMNSLPVTLLGLAGVCLVGRMAWRQRAEGWEAGAFRFRGWRLPAMVIAGVVLCNVLVFLSFGWGVANDYLASRVLLPFCLALALLGGCACCRSWYRRNNYGRGKVSPVAKSCREAAPA